MEEFRLAIARDPKLNASEEELTELYKAIDADGSNDISFKELNRVLRRSLRGSPSRSPSNSPPPPSSQAKTGVGRRAQQEAIAGGGARPDWDGRTRVDRGPPRGGRRSLGQPVLPNPQPWDGRK